MSRIVILTTEPLPLEGWPTTGAGLRTWGLGQGLRSRGHDVRLMMPEDAASGFSPGKDAKPPTRHFPDWIQTFNRSRLKEDPRVNDCDVLLLQHWGIARDLGEIHVPLAIDLAGPHLLERKLWGSPSPENDLLEKLDALRRADFLSASGEYQRYYFLPYLGMAGWDIGSNRDPLPVIPYSLQADANPSPVRNDRFIYGGFFLPWQNPARAIGILLDELESAGRGELVFIGGAHPLVDVSRGQFESLLQRLRSHPQVRLIDSVGYDDYVQILREGAIALDLMERNAERELAFTTRTVQFMACGLPVIHDNYSELGRIIEDHDAGWTCDPNDDSRLHSIFRGLLRGETDPQQKAHNALNLVAEKLDWNKTIGPLDEFCKAPTFRGDKLASQLAFEGRERRLQIVEKELEESRAELNTFRGKRWVQWGMKAVSLRSWLAWPAAVAATLFGLFLIPIFWINDRFGRPPH